MRKMGYQYELNVEVEITPNVYKECAKHIVEEYENGDEWGQQSDERKDRQYVWCHSSVGTVYLRRFKVQVGREDTEKYFLSQNVNSLKSDERNTMFTMIQEITDAKDNIEEFIKEIGFDLSFQLDQLMVGITEQESPYMK